MRLLPKFMQHLFLKCYEYPIVKKSGLFDEIWYLTQYPEVKDFRKSPLSHYIKHGYHKNYNPSLKFSTERYLVAYPDVKQSGKNPLLHYLKKGKRQGRICYTVQDMGELKTYPTKRKPLISVIVTSFNYEQYIRHTLESIEGQTYRNFEIIVVDDGSKDNSVGVIQEFVNMYDNIRFYQHPNGENKGLVASMKLGIDNAQGEYVAFCESDDYWDPQHIEKKVSMINRYENIIIISNKVRLFGDEMSVKNRQKYIYDIEKIVYPGGTPIDVKYNSSMNYIPTLSAVMIKRDVLSSLDFSTPIPAWIDFWIYRQILLKYILYHVGQELTFWRQHNSYNAPNNAEKFAGRITEFLIMSDNLLGIKTIKKNNKDICAIAKSNFFDEKYYIEQNKYNIINISPAAHYYYIGWKNGLNPSDQFDGDAYLAIYPDLYSAGICPLVHYISAGQKEGRIKFSVAESKAMRVTEDDINMITQLHTTSKTVLLISHELSLTGAPRALLNMAVAVKKAGMVPVIISNKHGELLEEIEKQGILCKIDINLLNLSSEKHPILQNYVSQFDIILFNTIVTAMLVTKMCNISAQKICWIHEGYIGYNSFPNNSQLLDAFSSYNRVFVVGEYAKAITKGYCNPNTKLETLLYYIDDVADSINVSVHNTGKMTMVIAGTIDERKGHDVLLESMSFIPKNVRDNIEVLIVGSPNNEIIYKKIRQSKYKCMQLIGAVTHNKLLSFMKGMDILLCPSIDDPMPIVCTEAFMLSKPVIVGSNTGTAAFVEDGENGFIVESGNAKSLAQTIIKAYEQRELLSQMGVKGRKIFEENFSYNSFYAKVCKIFV